jgi:hypothetical protein
LQGRLSGTYASARKTDVAVRGAIVGNAVLPRCRNKLLLNPPNKLPGSQDFCVLSIRQNPPNYFIQAVDLAFEKTTLARLPNDLLSGMPHGISHRAGTVSGELNCDIVSPVTAHHPPGFAEGFLQGPFIRDAVGSIGGFCLPQATQLQGSLRAGPLAVTGHIPGTLPVKKAVGSVKERLQIILVRRTFVDHRQLSTGCDGIADLQKQVG